MKKPDAHTVNMPPDVRGDDSVENVSTVILTLVQALLLIREHTDRAWNLEQKKTEREEGKRMKVKERKRAEFVHNVEEILARIQSQIAKGHVQEIVLAIGANICNPKEMWRFKLPPTSTASSAPAKFKRWRLLGTLPDEIHSRRASRGRIHLLVRRRTAADELDGFSQLHQNDYPEKGFCVNFDLRDHQPMAEQLATLSLDEQTQSTEGQIPSPEFPWYLSEATAKSFR